MSAEHWYLLPSAAQSPCWRCPAASPPAISGFRCTAWRRFHPPVALWMTLATMLCGYGSGVMRNLRQGTLDRRLIIQYLPSHHPRRHCRFSCVADFRDLPGGGLRASEQAVSGRAERATIHLLGAMVSPGRCSPGRKLAAGVATSDVRLAVVWRLSSCSWDSDAGAFRRVGRVHPLEARPNRTSEDRR